jgi:type IV secretion system protein VirB10
VNFLGRKRHEAAAEESSVAGERDEPAVNHAVSVQSRANRVLALGVIGVFGLGALIWYYSNTVKHQAHSRENANASVTNRLQSEMDLPSLGRIDPPSLTPASFDKTVAIGDDKSAAGGFRSTGYNSELPQVPGTYGTMNVTPTSYYTAPTEKTPAQLTLERQLSGVSFARSTQSLPDLSNASLDSSNDSDALFSLDRVAQPNNTLAALLKPTLAPAARARLLPTRRLLLPKGAFIDCTLETAIDSTLPGMTTCITATDTFGADGKVVLLERGTKLFGETRGQVRHGSSRLFVLWTEARTPTGVVVPLDSPGADELGRSGLPGSVNRHFFERFGAAILISMIDGAVQSVAQSGGNNGGTVIYNPTSSRDLMTEILKDTANIPPTVTKPQGDRIQILVARDLDFRSVYELRSSITTR